MIDDSDKMPLFVAPPSSKPNPYMEYSEEEYRVRFGPPFGPCGEACACEDCAEYRKQLREKGPEVAHKEIATSEEEIEEEIEYNPDGDKDPFDPVITHLIEQEQDLEWKTSMQKSPCFVKLWFTEEDGYCGEVDCQVRQYCQTGWESVKGGLVDPEMDENDYRTIGGEVVTRWRKGGRPKKKFRKFAGTNKYRRLPYTDQGRPVDQIAYAVWDHLKQPPTLPGKWYYPISSFQHENPGIYKISKKEQIELTKKAFICKFGEGLFVLRRINYHLYFMDGMHLMRMWMNSATGSWIDCSRELAQCVPKENRLILRHEKTKTNQNQKSSRAKYFYYPYRIYVYDHRTVMLLKHILTRFPALKSYFEPEKK